MFAFIINVRNAYINKKYLSTCPKLTFENIDILSEVIQNSTKIENLVNYANLNMMIMVKITQTKG